MHDEGESLVRGLGLVAWVKGLGVGSINWLVMASVLGRRVW